MHHAHIEDALADALRDIVGFLNAAPQDSVLMAEAGLTLDRALFPLLVRIGLTPVRAVVAGLLGLVLVPWGSLGPGTLVAAQLGGEDVTELGYRSAVLSLPVLVVSMVTVLM